MFKKPVPVGKENSAAPRPRLGLSSLQHTAKIKVESEIESAGASLKVLSVENSREKVTSSSTTAANRGSTQPAQSTARSTNPKSNTTTTGAAKATHNGVLRKNADTISAPNGQQKVVKAEKQIAANEAKPKPPSPAEHINGQNAGARNVNADGKPVNGTATQQQQSTIKKSWELSNFDIGRPLGRGMFVCRVFLFKLFE